MEVEEFLKEAAVMKEIKHPNLVQLLGECVCSLLASLKHNHMGTTFFGRNNCSSGTLLVFIWG